VNFVYYINFQTSKVLHFGTALYGAETWELLSHVTEEKIEG
jgi:hypothetical protein